MFKKAVIPYKENIYRPDFAAVICFFIQYSFRLCGHPAFSQVSRFVYERISSPLPKVQTSLLHGYNISPLSARPESGSENQASFFSAVLSLDHCRSCRCLGEQPSCAAPCTLYCKRKSSPQAPDTFRSRDWHPHFQGIRHAHLIPFHKDIVNKPKMQVHILHFCHRILIFHPVIQRFCHILNSRSASLFQNFSSLTLCKYIRSIRKIPFFQRLSMTHQKSTAFHPPRQTVFCKFSHKASGSASGFY